MAQIQADPLADLYGFVEEQCTLEQIQDLLREAKHTDKSVRVSETNKSKVVQQNLRLAVDRRHVSVEAVQDLVRYAEENGHQHIFLYRPRTDAICKAYSDLDSVAHALFGSKWPGKLGFPRYLKLPPSEEWVDFRGTADGGWVAKVYGRQTITERLGPEELDRVEDGVEFLIQRLRRRTVRTTILARFAPRSRRLELRVPLTSSRRTLDGLVTTFKEMLSPAVKLKKDFDDWNLAETRVNMLKNYDPKNGVFRVKDTRFRNATSDTASFSSHDDEDGRDLFADIRTKQAIESLLKGSPECEQLAFWFLKTSSTDAIKEDVRVSMGSFASNELMVGAHTTPVAIDYILQRITEKS